MRWRDIAGWEGLYQMSEGGDVRRLRGPVIRRNNVPHTVGRTRQVKPYWRGGCWSVTLSRPGHRECRYIPSLYRATWGQQLTAGGAPKHASTCTNYQSQQT